jgi:hypothetical protein
MENHLAADSLRWLTGLEIPPDDIEAQLLRCLGCWAAGSLTELSPSDPAHAPLHRLLGLPAFAVNRYSGDPVLALAMHAALRRRGLRHQSLAELAGVYALVVDSADWGRIRRLGLIRALLESAGLRSPTPEPTAESEPAARSEAARESVTAPESTGQAVESPDIDWDLSWINDRDGLLRFCETVAMTTVWGTRPVQTAGLVNLLPPLAVSYAMEADLDAVCTLLRACAYLGFADEPGCHWARQRLIEEHRDGRFGVITNDVTPNDVTGKDVTSKDAGPFALTVQALWTLAELRRPGFLLGPATAATGIRSGITATRPAPSHELDDVESAPY